MQEEGNVMVSPISIAIALGMAACGEKMSHHFTLKMGRNTKARSTG